MGRTVVLMCLLLSGCAAEVLSSSERTVVVKARTQDAAQAQALATAECKKHGLFARLSMKTEAHQYVFDCVP